MIPTVVLVLALAASGLSLPVTTQEHVSTENKNAPHILTEVPVPQFVEKTGVQSSPEVYSPVAQVLSSTPVPKPENVQQVSYSENPVLLPIQPLSVVQVEQIGPVQRPVIVPAEAITSGRVIIAGIQSIQEKNYPQVSYQQVTDPVTYTPVQVQGVEQQQSYYVQTNEKQTPVQQDVVPAPQEYTPGQVQPYQQRLVGQQVVENVEQVQNYNPVPVEQNQQVYSVQQNVQPVVDTPEKNIVSGFVPVQTVQQSAQNFVEKLVPYQQGSYQQGYTPVQNQGVDYQQQVYNAQQVEKQGEYQQVNTYNPIQNQAVEQQVYDVQSVVEKTGHYQTQSAEPVQQQVQTIESNSEVSLPRIEPVEQSYQQQVYSTQPVHQVSVQTHLIESANQQQVYNAQPAVPDQVPYQQVVQQQTYNLQPVVPDQVQYQQEVQQQSAGYVPEQISKVSEVENQQPYVQSQQVVEYPNEAAYADKTSQQHTPVHTLSVAPQPQVTSVQPSVISPQE